MKKIYNKQQLMKILNEESQVGWFTYKNKSLYIGLKNGADNGSERLMKHRRMKIEKGICDYGGCKNKPMKGVLKCKKHRELTNKRRRN
mgnify:CR=1 FL=1